MLCVLLLELLTASLTFLVLPLVVIVLVVPDLFHPGAALVRGVGGPCGHRGSHEPADHLPRRPAARPAADPVRGGRRETATISPLQRLLRVHADHRRGDRYLHAAARLAGGIDRPVGEPGQARPRGRRHHRPGRTAAWSRRPHQSWPTPARAPRRRKPGTPRPSAGCGPGPAGLFTPVRGIMSTGFAVPRIGGPGRLPDPSLRDALRGHQPRPRARRDVGRVHELPVQPVVVPVELAEPQAAGQRRRDVQARSVVKPAGGTSVVAARRHTGNRRRLRDPRLRSGRSSSSRPASASPSGSSCS